MKRIIVSMKDEDVAEVGRLADMLQQSRSSLIRRAVREMLERRENINTNMNEGPK